MIFILIYFIITQYLLSKIIYRTFSHDFKLASYKPNINDYKPDHNLTTIHNTEQKQGINAELLDQIVQAFIVRDPIDNIVRIMTYGEFYRCWNNKSDGQFDFTQVEYLLKNFHPNNKKILWRILISQAYIYKLLIDNYLSNDSENISQKISLMNLDNEQMTLFDWRKDEDMIRIKYYEVMEPFNAVQEYLKKEVAVDYIKYRGCLR